MEKKQELQSEEQEFKPDMLWEGFIYLAFFIFFCIYLIPNTPAALSFNRYYPIAMITYGFAGIMTGRIVYVLTRRMHWIVKAIIVVILYAFVVSYLVTHIHHFSMK